MIVSAPPSIGSEALTIVIKRMQGTARELSSWKKGKKFRTVSAVETELWHMCQTVPPDCEHKVAYEVQREDGQTLYGSFLIRRVKPTERPLFFVNALKEQYGLELR